MTKTQFREFLFGRNTLPDFWSQQLRSPCSFS